MSSTLLADEHRFVDRASHTYTCDGPLSKVMRGLTVKTFAPWFQGGRALEMGCADGVMTEMLAARVESLDVVDGSENFLAKARQRQLPNVRFRHALFEEFETQESYDYVFATYILEHVIDPVRVLSQARAALRPGGRLFIVVPNARALSRQLALRMGLLEDLKELTGNDKDHGHRRVYDRTSLNRDIETAGLETLAQGGLLLKILADFQLDELITRGTLRDEHFEGLYQLGLENPELCGSLFAVCTPKP